MEATGMVAGYAWARCAALGTGEPGVGWVVHLFFLREYALGFLGWFFKNLART